MAKNFLVDKCFTLNNLCKIRVIQGETVGDDVAWWGEVEYNVIVVGRSGKS